MYLYIVIVTCTVIFGTVVSIPVPTIYNCRDKFELSSKLAYVYSRYAWQLLGTDPVRQAARHGRRRPTFREFAAYLVREPADRYDNHWLPYWLHCHLCALEYDVIAKMETFQEDMHFVTGSL